MQEEGIWVPVVGGYLYFPLGAWATYDRGDMATCTVEVVNSGGLKFKPKLLCQLMQRRWPADYNDCVVLWHTQTAFVEPGHSVTMVCQQRVLDNAGYGNHWSRIEFHAILEDGSDILIRSPEGLGFWETTIPGLGTPDCDDHPIAAVVASAAPSGELSSWEWS
jgi:hypothetical protein